MNDQSFERFIVHYYLKDNSHSMNAFIRNQLEQELLKAIQSMASLLKIEIQIESQAYEKGGLIETLTIKFNEAIDFAIPIFNNLIYIHITGKKEKMQLENEMKKLEVENKRLDLYEKENELYNTHGYKSAKKHISNFYKRAKDYSIIDKIGYRTIDEEEEIVDRGSFGNFIIEDTKEIQDIQEDNEAKITIISPVLNEGTYKWKGIYQREKIDFSMADASFKKDVISGKYEFANGSVIECCLEIKIIFDDFQEIKNKTYRVLEVYEVQKDKNSTPFFRKSKKQRTLQKDTRSLFDWEN